MNGKAILFAVASLLPQVMPSVIAKSKPDASSNKFCSPIGLYYDGCPDDDGLQVVKAGVDIVRALQSMPEIPNKYVLRRLFNFDLLCTSELTTLQMSPSAKQDLQKASCGSQIAVASRRSGLGEVVYETLPQQVKTLHWQLRLSIVVPLRATDVHAQIFLFMRTAFPGFCPSKIKLRSLASERDFFGANVTRQSPHINSDNENSSQLMWVLEPANRWQGGVQLTPANRKNGAFCDVLISASAN